MSKDLEIIKFELLTACETGTVDIDQWIQKFPEHRNELLDFWLWARPRAEIDRAGPTDMSPRSIASIRDESLHRACIAVSLGSEWLRPLAVEVEIDKIAQGVRQLKKQPAAKVPLNRRPFRRAVVYAWVIEQLAEVRTRVSRLATQKTTYLLESFLVLELFDTHKQKPLGPYDHVARYTDAEPIAEKKGWIEVVGSTMYVGAKASEFRQYASRYLRSTKLASTLTRWLGIPLGVRTFASTLICTQSATGFCTSGKLTIRPSVSACMVTTRQPCSIFSPTATVSTKYASCRATSCLKRAVGAPASCCHWSRASSL